MDMLRDGKSGTSSPGVGPDGAARGGGSPGMRGGRWEIWLNNEKILDFYDDIK